MDDSGFPSNFSGAISRQYAKLGLQHSSLISRWQNDYASNKLCKRLGCKWKIQQDCDCLLGGIAASHQVDR